MSHVLYNMSKAILEFFGKAIIPNDILTASLNLFAALSLSII